MAQLPHLQACVRPALLLLQTMAGIDDDATLTQLALAWVGQALVSAGAISWGWHGWWSMGCGGVADARYCEALARACRGTLASGWQVDAQRLDGSTCRGWQVARYMGQQGFGIYAAVRRDFTHGSSSGHMQAVRLRHVTASQGGAKVQEAAYVYQELGEKYNWTVSSSRGEQEGVATRNRLQGGTHRQQRCSQAQLADMS